eukprot:5626062-Prymnesium_polylepis.1
MASWRMVGFPKICRMLSVRPQRCASDTRRIACSELPPSWKKLSSRPMADESTSNTAAHRSRSHRWPLVRCTSSAARPASAAFELTA